jgi:hypothetical protein
LEVVLQVVLDLGNLLIESRVPVAEGLDVSYHHNDGDASDEEDRKGSSKSGDG